MAREVVTAHGIAVPVGPFFPAVRAGEFIYLSGQVAQDPMTGRLIAVDVTAQTSSTTSWNCWIDFGRALVGRPQPFPRLPLVH